MRTYEEIHAKLKAVASDDLFGHWVEALMIFLPFEEAQPYLNDTTVAKSSRVWEEQFQEANTRESVLNVAEKYMGFAWDKVQDHRGLSAGRSIEKMEAWLWLLGDGDKIDWERYSPYGAPILAEICKLYNWPVPESPELSRMISGNTCEPNCNQGCRGF